MSTTFNRRTVTCWTLFVILVSIVPWAQHLNSLKAAPAIVSAGQEVSAQTQPLSAMLNADGSLNLTPGVSGSVDITGYTMYVDQAGAPSFAPVQPQVAGDQRWEPRFGPTGIKETTIRAMAVAANGDLYVGGDFTQIGALSASNIARWDGQRWYPLGAGLTMKPMGNVHQIAILGTNVYVVGEFTRAGTQTANAIARWDGTTWSRVGSGIGPKYTLSGGQDSYLYTVAVQGTSIVVGGHFNQIDGVAANNIARWNGTAWSALGQGIGKNDFDGTFTPDATVYGIVTNGTQIYAGGDFDVAGTVVARAIAQWNGTAWAALGNGLTDDTGNAGRVRALGVNGMTVYAGGTFANAGTVPAQNVAVWSGGAWSAMDLGVGGGADFFETVQTILVSGARVYIGGYFTEAGGETRRVLALWNNSSKTWSDVGPALTSRFEDSHIHALALSADGALYAGGSFELAGDLFVTNIAKLKDAAWQTLGQGVGDFGNSDSGTIYAMAIDAAGRIFIGGQFNYAGGVPVKNLAMYDGGQWYNIGEADQRVRALIVVGDILYAAGEFTTISGVATNHIGQWDRTTRQWSSVGGGINGDVYALAYADGLVYAGGNYTNAGDVAAYDLAYWNGTAWSAFGEKYRIFEAGDQGGEVGTIVYALAVQHDTVIIGGYFQTIHQLGTDTRPITNYRLVNNVVGWKRTGDVWFYVGNLTATEEPGVTNNGFSGFGTQVRAVAIDGSEIYVGGTFNQAGTTGAANIVRWNSATRQWSKLGSGVTGVGNALRPTEVWALTMRGSELYVGGHFTAVDAGSAKFVARWNTKAGNWSLLGSGIKWYNDEYTYVYALGTYMNVLYVGGVFSSAGGQSALGFAQWTSEQTNADPTATGTIVVPGNPTTGPTTGPGEKFRLFIPSVQR